jgi:hypothetical protein
MLLVLSSCAGPPVDTGDGPTALTVIPTATAPGVDDGHRADRSD